jgi:two-component system alkaline phosphatase synthesis response regulator PhoP
VPPTRPTILIVEDDHALRQYYRVALELRGFSVEVAADGFSALKLIEEGPRPQLIVLDLGLPRVGGFEVASELAANAATTSIPIVVVTGSTDTFDEQPFAAVLRKPVSPDHIAFVVERTLRRSTV